MPAMRFILLLLLIGLAIAGQRARRASAGDPRPAQTRPATQPTTAPARSESLLLLDDEEEETGAAKKPQADNSRCHVCHINFETEHLAQSHARANVGCATCHGASDAHIADESWASGGNGTAPEIMFPPEKIVASCLACHARQKLADEPHKAFFDLTTKEKLCTECHGKHRMASRKCKWK